jgi:hypothetical protein
MKIHAIETPVGIEDELRQLVAQNEKVFFYPAYRAALRLLARQGPSIALNELVIRIRRAEEDAAPAARRYDGVQELRIWTRDLLEKLGRRRFGRFILGRRGKPTRFELAASFRDEIVRACKAEELAAIPPEPPEPPSPPKIRHAFALRPDFPVLLDLPPDLTRAEAARLARFAESLSFEGAA